MPIMQLLKESTKDRHNSAENQDFQRQLAAGELSSPLYVAYLEQLYLIHERLESHLQACGAQLPAVAQIVTAEQYQVPFLEDDLAYFGASLANIKPEAATLWLISRIDQVALTRPIALLGFHYVLLGSKHGGKFIAHNLQSKYQLKEGRGARYFDPYGPEFQQLWKNFADQFNQYQLSEEETNATVQGAKDMFDGIGRLSREVWERALV